MSISTLAIAGISLDASGLYRQTSSAPDGVFIFNDGVQNWEIINKKGPYVARLGGILPSLPDATSSLQLILNNSEVTEVVFDEGDITINGTLTVPSGKILTFQNNGRLIGSGTVNGGIINADYQKSIFDITLTVNPAGVSNKYFSGKWFGATGTGSTNDHPAIQTAIYTVIRNRSKVKTVFLPEGSYRIDSPLIMHNWNGTNYAFFNCDLVGESSFWEESSAGTKIIANFTDTFAIGVQAGKGVRIKNLYLIGKFVHNFTNSAAFYALDYNSYGSVIPCRDNRYSPYSGIVIDPFTNSAGSAPAIGDIYPGNDGYIGTLPSGAKTVAPTSLSSYYRGTGGSLGSTGVTIDDSFISNFTIGIITSPNGVTLNAELIEVNRIQFADCKACIAGCQAQEKLNRVSFFGCWGPCHTMLMYNRYGQGEPGHWLIENVNIAGYVNRLIERNDGGYFPMKITNVYAESLGKIGDVGFTMGSMISDSMFDFARPDSTDYGTKQYFLSVATGSCTFKNVLFRYYGTDIPVAMDGRHTLTECRSTLPLLLPDQYQVSGERYLGTSIQDNGNINGWTTLNATYPQCVLPANAFYYFADGKSVLESNVASAGLKVSHQPKLSIPYSYVMEKFATKAVTRTGANNTFTFTLTVDELSWIYQGATVGFFNNKFFGYGVVTSISGSNVTISYIPDTVVNDTYELKVYRKLQFFTFLGDISSGSNQITNVRVDMGSASSFVNDNTIFIQDVVASTDNGRTSFRLTNWDNSTKTLTANKNFNVTKTGVYFSNNGYVKDVSAFATDLDIFTSPYTKDYILQKGGRLTTMVNGEPLTYLVTKSGYIDASYVSDSRQAEWVLENCCTTSTTTTTP